MWNRILTPDCLITAMLPLAASLAVGHLMVFMTPSTAQITPERLSRDCSSPSQRFFEDGLDQLEREIRILQRQEMPDTAILTIQQDVQLSPYEIERLSDDDAIEIRPDSEASEETDVPAETR